jgi:hypothetical protein
MNNTGYCYGVVSYKASHALRSFSDILCIPVCILLIPDSTTSDLWLQHRHVVTKQGAAEKCL